MMRSTGSLGLVVALAVVTACGEDGTGSGDSDSDTDVTTDPSSSGGTGSGSSGGTATGTDGGTDTDTDTGTGTGTDSGTGTGEEPSWVFVSIPDWLNNDVDYRDERWTGQFDDDAVGYVDFVLDSIVTENPDFVLVAGDLVMGRWGLSGTGTLQERVDHVSTMGDRFFGGWDQEFVDRGLTYYAAVGDHEVGDNPWPDWKVELVPEFKAAFTRNIQMPENGPTDYLGTAFSVLHDNVELFAVDVFEVHDGVMTVGVTGAQITWLDEALAASSATFKIVTGHVPVLPGFLSRSSSKLELEGGPDSALWQTMVEHDVDLYMAGEVHDVSFQRQDGLLQLMAGTQASNTPDTNYTVVRVYADRIEIEIKLIPHTLEGPNDKNLDPYGVDPYTERFVKISAAQQEAGWKTVGTMVVDRSQGFREYTKRTGFFETRWTDY